MRFGSVCSGIEAASVAWNPLGWRAEFVSEIDRFPCALLEQRHGSVPNLGDMTKFKDWPDAAIDVLVGGTPCQSFSVAGLRGGLADPRGNLMLTYLAIAARYRPEWLVWENVPGVLSSNGGRDFGSLLGGMGKLGYGFAYRVLDAQYFNLAQRRERVFVVGCLGGWQRAAAVLFERASLRGDLAPSRTAWKDFAHELAPSIGASGRGFSRAGETRGQDPVIAAPLLSHHPRSDGESETFVPVLAGTVGASSSSGRSYGSSPIADNLVTHALRADGFDASEDGTGRGTPLVVAPPLTGNPYADNLSREGLLVPVANTLGANSGRLQLEQNYLPVAFNTRQDPISGPVSGPLDTDGTTQAIAFSCKDHGADAGELAPTLRAMNHTGSHANAGGQVAVAFAQNSRSEVREMPIAGSVCGDVGVQQQTYVKSDTAVRRLTPAECEALQGFPRNYTLIEYRGKPAADGPRYKALGNSMARPVMTWIGRRIQLVHELIRANIDRTSAEVA